MPERQVIESAQDFALCPIELGAIPIVIILIVIDPIER
jgi:hypothetical protein